VLRRLGTAVVGAALIASLSISSALAAPSPAGVLSASFEAYGSSGSFYATEVHGAQGYNYAANQAIDFGNGAIRLGLVSGGTYCASNVFGIWVIGIWTPKTDLANSTWSMSFGPSGGTLTPLAIQRTAVKPVNDPQGAIWGGIPLYWQSIGVPVYGFLTPGTYTLHVDVTGLPGVTDPDGNAPPWNPVFTIDNC
jgi:hypothetical protein